jgi:cell division protein FtsI/penicillin-binding protein 2
VGCIGVRQGRYRLCSALVIAAFLVVGWRLTQLHVVQADELKAAVESQRMRLVVLEGRRGDILDRNGQLLAGTRTRIEVGVDPQSIDLAEERKIAHLAALLDQPHAVVLEKCKRRTRIDSKGRERRVAWVKLGEVDEALYDAIGALELRGVYGNRRYERFYPGEGLAEHVVGYLNKEQVPVMGVEETLDLYLRGQRGWRETEVDGRRRELAAFRHREVQPRDGETVRLTIDQYIQSRAEAAIDELVARDQPDAVSIIISRPQSGEVLAMANYPGFDPNQFWEFPLEAQRNRAVSDQYEPGSTFKVVTYAAALEEGVVQADSLIDCTAERITYKGVSIPMPEDSSVLGTAPVSQLLKKSSNRGAAQIGMLLGEERIFDYAQAFGIGRDCGWPLRGTFKGTLHEPKDWDRYMISRVPMGYAVGTTPLQIHQSMAIIANGGLHVRPRLFLSIGETNEAVPLGETPEARVISEDTARVLSDLLKGVVAPDGTAPLAAVDGYEIAGKTGTTRMLVDGKYSQLNYVASFSGFFPASDPEVVITIVVTNPNWERIPPYGGRVAGPVFKELAQVLIPHLSIRQPEALEAFIAARD